MNTERLLARAEREIRRVELGGGPVPSHRASYRQAVTVVDGVRRGLRHGGLGILPLLPLLGWAVAALVGVSTVVGGIAIVRSTDAAAGAAADAVQTVGTIVSVGLGLFAASMLAPMIARGYRGAREALA